MKKIFYFICIMCIGLPVYGKLSATSFPTTVQDLSFKSRVEIAAEGYRPFLDKKAYQELNIIPGEEIYTDRIIADALAEKEKQEEQEKDAQSMNIADYCEKHPSDETKCPQQTTTPAQTTEQMTPTNQYVPLPVSTFSGYTIGGGQVIENNFVTGGSCYPAARVHSGMSNKVLTTGKYERIHPALEKGLITVFRKEGACGTIKGDPCGYTCYGIGSSSKCSGIVVHSRAEAEDVYYNRYWKPHNIDKLPDVIATDIFLASMASGAGTALSQFRKFLGLPKKTSPVDNEMIRAVNNYNGDIHNDWMNVREKFLMEVADKYLRKYGTDIRRGYRNAIDLKRKNGCHVRPSEPIYR